MLYKLILLSIISIASYAMNCSGYGDFKKFNGHYYTITAKRITFDQARQLAESEGGYLAIPSSQAENDFIRSLIPQPQYAWIGVHDPNNMQNFCFEGDACAYDASRFVDIKGNPLTYSNWAQRQPDNLVKSYDIVNGKQMVAPLGEHWVAMSSIDGKWADFGNHADQYNNPVRFYAVLEFEQMPECYQEPSNVQDKYKGAKCNTQLYDNGTGAVTNGRTYSCQKDKYGKYYCPVALAECGQEWDYKDSEVVTLVGQAKDYTEKNECNEGKYEENVKKCVTEGLVKNEINIELTKSKHCSCGWWDDYCTDTGSTRNVVFNGECNYGKYKFTKILPKNGYRAFVIDWGHGTCGYSQNRYSIITYKGSLHSRTYFSGDWWYGGYYKGNYWALKITDVWGTIYIDAYDAFECGTDWGIEGVYKFDSSSYSRGYILELNKGYHIIVRGSNEPTGFYSTGLYLTIWWTKDEYQEIYTPPSCPAGYTDNGDGKCSKDITYSYYKYICSSDPNYYGQDYQISDPGLSSCNKTDPDPNNPNPELAEPCNSETPPPNNCKRLKYVCQPAPNRECVWVDNKWQCSPFPCFGAGEGDYNVTDTDTPVGINDANNNGWDSSGACAGKLYIFNGQDNRCRSDDLFFGLMGGGCCKKDDVFFGLVECKESEKKLAKLRKQNRCHYIGEYCSKELDLLVGKICIQHKKTYCCFNSKLARIINEQGRVQLKKSWGSAKSPNCRGFTPEEFQKIDFSKLDLSEFYGDISAHISSTALQNTNDYIKNSIQSQLQNITGGK